MRIDHYGIRNKTRKHRQWGMSQFNKFEWKLGTQNLVATSTMTEAKFKALSKVHFGQAIHVWSKMVKEECCWVWNSLCISNSAIWFWIGLPSSTYKFEIDF